jgi:hypothetical protein
MILKRKLTPSTTARIGMASLAAAVMWPRLVHPTAGLGPDLIDAVQGFLFGLAIGLNLIWVRINSRRRDGEGC